MCTAFSINTTFIPARITQAYLSHYSVPISENDEVDKTVLKEVQKNQRILAEGAALLEQIIDESRQALSISNARPTPGANTVTMIVGTIGVGKSRYTSELMKDLAYKAVIADVDDILARMPSVAAGIKRMEDTLRDSHYANVFYSAAQHRALVEETVGIYRPLAEAIRDNIVSTFAAEGYDVLMQTSGKSRGIGHLIDALKRAGITVNSHLCESTLAVKKSGAISADHGGISLPADVIEADHEDARNNMLIIEARSDNTRYFWRSRLNEPLAEVGRGDFLCHVSKDGPALVPMPKKPAPIPGLAIIS